VTATVLDTPVTAPARRTRRGWRWWAYSALIALATGWLAFTVGQWMFSGRWWLWLAVSFVPPGAFLVVPPLLALAAAPCRRSRRPVALIALAALVLGAPFGGVNVAAIGHGRTPAPPGAVHVFSWNTEYWDQGGQAAAFFPFLVRQHADVYLLQEYMFDGVAPTPVDDLGALTAAFPGFHIASVGEELTISRYPILAQTPIVAPDMPAPAQPGFPTFWLDKVLRTDLDVDGRTLSVYNVHMPVQMVPSNPLSPAYFRTVHQQDRQREPVWRALAADVAANPNPIILAGDLNTTPAMGDLRKMPPSLRDASYAMTDIYPVSWYDHPGIPMWWRLDWVFVSHDVTVHDYGFASSGGLSDHRYQHFTISF
jgi:endonuclease/exonuclease/phosphatase (EEP) superfamily protein YafD